MLVVVYAKLQVKLHSSFQYLIKKASKLLFSLLYSDTGKYEKK